MHTLILLVFSALVAWSQAQNPPEYPSITQANSAQTTQQEKESKQAHEESSQPRVQGQQETGFPPNENDAKKKANEELTINRKLANFTMWLVIVGVLQIVALVTQARIFWVTLHENRRLITAAVDSANAARDGVAAAVESNTLTQESNLTTAQATELTRQSLVLTHRPKLVVRNLYPDTTQGFVADSHAEGWFNIVNVGGTDATVTAIYADVILSWNVAAGRPYGGKTGDKVRITLKPGESIERQFRKGTPILKGDADSLLEAARTGSGHWLHVLGFVSYVDDMGTPRKTAFCRRWNMHFRRFEKIDNPDYEHED